MRSRVDELAGPWLQPISAEARAGRDARHEHGHETVRAEIAKLSGMHDAKVDWAQVERAGTDLLTTKTKDLVIATYVACALHEQAGLPGLARGTALLAGLMTDFAADLFPARTRARANALEWFAERSASRLGDASGSAADLALLRGLSLMLDGAARSALGDEAPSLRPLNAAIERLGLSATAAEEVPQGPAPVESGLPQGSPQPAQTENRGGDPSEPPALEAGRLHTQAEAWLLPISESSPAGADTSYADSHTRVRSEIQKLESPAGQHPDWMLVFTTTEALLRTETKDLVLATYLAAALWETRQLEGLTLGLSILCGLVERYWDSMWPTVARPRRRANALVWLVERMGPALSSGALSPNDRPLLDACEGEARRLGELLRDRLNTESPSLRPLLDAIGKLRTSVREVPAPAAPTPRNEPASRPSPQNGPAPAPPVAVSATPVAVPSTVSVPQDLAELSAFLRRTGSNLVEAAQALRSAEPANPRAYRLLRAGLWLHTDSLPPADAQGRTRIPPPDKRGREALDTFFANARWEALLDQAEGMAALSPFWLDPHFFAARSLEGLGERFSLAAAALTGEARAFADRLSGLTQLRFSDGTPLGSPDTVTWLRRPGAGPTPIGQAVATDASLPELLRAGLLRGEAAAVQQLDQRIQAATSLRAAFSMRLELAEVLLEAAKLEQAVAAYLGLEQDLDAHGIERWEPDLALHVLRGLWSALAQSAQAGGKTHPEATRVCARLARLSPTALL